MKTFKFALAALTAAVLSAGAGAAQAMPIAKAAGAHAPMPGVVVQVRHMGHHHMHGGPRVYHGHHHYRHFRHFGFGPRITIYGGGGCYWLKERALATGSRYWWRRYHHCRGSW